MSVEADLTTLLKGLCPRVSSDFAPTGTARPYVTWQLIGGQALRMLDNTAASKRHSLVQINVWDDTRPGCQALMRQIEDALCAATVFTARPESEPTADAEPGLEPPRFGAMQDFSIWSDR